MNRPPQTEPAWEEIRQWRKSRRAELIALREATPLERRTAWNRRITEALAAGFQVPPQSVVGFCWPYKGEFDARHVVRAWRDKGAVTALPEVTSPKAPLQFRTWSPGVSMRPGVYGIPVPDGTEIVVPDIALVPMNAFDLRGYRLGYGGGFFDRTLAACERGMIAIGVSYELLQVDTIYPQSHDIPMDFVVTEEGVYGGGDGLRRLDAGESALRLRRLMAARRLPRTAHSGEYSSPVCYAHDFPGYWDEISADEPKKKS